MNKQINTNVRRFIVVETGQPLHIFQRCEM